MPDDRPFPPRCSLSAHLSRRGNDTCPGDLSWSPQFLLRSQALNDNVPIACDFLLLPPLFAMIRYLTAGVFSALATFIAPALAIAASSFDVAITVDDLPAHGRLPPGMSWLGITKSHLEIYKSNGVKEAFGFVNAGKIATNPDGAAILDVWRDAGHPLGNHTYSHMNLSQAPTLEAWFTDVEAGEAPLKARMAGTDWHYLRFPFLNSGEQREPAALEYLRAHGYKVADVSISFRDHTYTDAYYRCVEKNDLATITTMKAAYLADIDAAIAQMKEQSMQIYGRVIPQVLLTHLGGWSAVTLPDVMSKLNAAGAHYVTLAQAQSDPAYSLVGGGSVLARAAKQKGIKLNVSNPTLSSAEIEKLCR